VYRFRYQDRFAKCHILLKCVHNEGLICEKVKPLFKHLWPYILTMFPSFIRFFFSQDTILRFLFLTWKISQNFTKILVENCRIRLYIRGGSSGGGRGGRTRPAPPLKLDKIWFFGVKSWFFTRNIPNIFAPPSARRNVFKCARPQLGILDPPLYIVVVYVRSSYIVFYNSWQMKVYTSIAFPTQIVQQGSGEGVTRYILMYASWKQTHCLDQTSRCWVELV
jgi:hypothetical protein